MIPTNEADLNRSQQPQVPAVMADLWKGWDYPGMTGAPQADAQAAAAALRGISTVVNAMAGGDTFRVTLQGEGTAWTDLKARMVAVTSAALYDRRLTDAEALAITTAMAMHEAGHGRITGPMERAVRRAFGDPSSSLQAGLAGRLSNIVEDVRLEADTAAQWPAYAGVFDLCLWWVTQRYPSGGVDRLPGTQPEAVNFCIAATRYDRWTEWASDAAVQAEREWWIEWIGRAAVQHRPGKHVAAIAEALDHIAALPGSKAERDEAGEAEGDGAGDGVPNGEDADDEPREGDDDGSGSGWSPEALDAEDDDADDEAGGFGDEDDDDEPLDAQGLPGEGGGAADGDDEGEAEGGTSGGEAGDEPSDAPGSHDGSDGVYHEADEAGDGGDTDPSSDDDGDGDIVFGKTPDRDWDEAGQRQMDVDDSLRPDRDALADPLPAHAAEATSDDDRQRDHTLAGRMLAEAKADAGGSILVTHEGGANRRAGITPLVTDRVSIATDSSAQAALRGAFASRRTSHDDRDVARAGKVKGGRLYRSAYGDPNVFTRRDAISPDRLDLHLLVDASGSMHSRVNGFGRREYGPRRVEQAAQMAANITEALAHLPYVRVHVWAHNTVNGTTLWDVYDSRRGDPIGRMAGIRASGSNNDATAIAALAATAKRERNSRERSIIVVVSDGAPCEPVEWVRGAVDRARTDNIGVMSVAIAGGLTKIQEQCYGSEWVVPWSGDWGGLARGIALMVGRLA